MRFPYLIGTAPRPQPSLGGSRFRPRPIIAVRVTGPAQSLLRDRLLDTGSDDTVFPDGLAKAMGVDLNLATSHTMALAGRGLVHGRFAQITLWVADRSFETYEWVGMVGFVSVPLRRPLLGFAGFMQYFDADFRGADCEVSLTPNRTFPGQRIPFVKP